MSEPNEKIIFFTFYIIALVFDAKDKGTFRLGRWQRDYNWDLRFTTKDHRDHTIPISREVFNDFSLEIRS